MKRFSFGSLRLRLIILVLIATIPALGVTLYSGLEQCGQERQRAFDDALKLAQNISETHNRLIQNARHILFALSKTSEIQQLDKAALSKIFADIVKQSEGYASLVAAKPNGELFASGIPTTHSVNYSDRSWFQRVLKTRGFVIGEYLIGYVSGKPLIALAHPVLDDTGNPKTILALGMDLEWLNKTIVKSELPEGTSVIVIDSDGTVLFRHPEPDKFVGKDLPEASIVKYILANREGVEETVGIEGIPRLFGFTMLGKGVESIHVAVGIPKQVALAQADRVMKQNLSYLGLIALFALATAWFMGGFLFIHPVNRLLETTKRIEEGDLTARVGPSYGKGEIGQLAYAFDQMAESLKKREAELRRTMESLRESEEKYRLVLENAYDAIFIAQDEVVKFPNPKTQEMSGYSAEELAKLPFISLVHPEDKDMVLNRYMRWMKRGELPEAYASFRIINKAGEELWVELNTTAVSWNKRPATLNILRDITSQKKWEAQFLQAQKMEAIGTLAGGVAHDFNNLLTAILGYAELSLMGLGKDNSLRENIEEIKKAGNSAASLTRKLLAFSRKQIVQPKVVDLNEFLSGMEKMLGRLLGEDVELLTIPEPALWQVEADPGQMEQVIMNLAVNARDAMPMGGKLTIETANMDLEENYFREHGIREEQPGSYVVIAVNDTGSGMDKKTQEHIFEPFFTTKEIDKGTGLGLSTVYGIVKQNNGFIWVYSEPGQGTTFKVYLPKVKGDVEAVEKERTPVVKLDGSETVLIVEDDDGLRKLAQNVLQQHGYRVLTAENGEDALKVSEAHDGSIDLMITDVVMPKMSGRETAERLQPLRSKMKVLYMSGYTDNAIAHHGVLAPGLNFLEKPFSPKALARKVREVLDK